MPADAGAAPLPGEEIAVSLSLVRHRVAAVRIAGRRLPPVARLAAGRDGAVAAAMLGRLFTLCAHAQAAALRTAAAAARGEARADGRPDGATGAILAERMMELLRGTLVALAGPAWTGFAPALRALAAACRGFEAPALSPVAPLSPAASRSAIAAIADGLAALGLPAGVVADPADFRRWLGSDAALPALLRPLADPADDPPAPAPDALGPRDDVAVAAALEADPDFARVPRLAGRVPETGPLARNHAHPLFAAAGHGVFARFVARLIDIAETPRRLQALTDDPASSSDLVTATPLGPRRGLAAVECARGRLYHLVTLDAAGRIARLDMLAPTEWNFHADGPLARALIGRTLDAESANRRRIGWLLSAFDPCVAHRLEIVETADA